MSTECLTEFFAFLQILASFYFPKREDKALKIFSFHLRLILCVVENLWKEFNFHLQLLDTYASTLKNTIMAKIVIFAFSSIFGNKVLILV